MLEASAYIFEQAAYQGMAAEPLYEFLLEAGFDDAHAKVKKSEKSKRRAVLTRRSNLLFGSLVVGGCVAAGYAMTGVWTALEL